MLGMDAKAWFSEASRQRVTDELVARALDVTRKTANKRLNEGLSADDVIELARAFKVNPAMALVELDHITYEDVADYLDSDGQLVATAEPGVLALELARQLNPATMAPELDELASRRSNASTPNVGPLDDDDAAVRDANELRGAAQKRTPRLDEPEHP